MRMLFSIPVLVAVVLGGCAGTPEARSQAEARKSGVADSGIVDHAVRQERVRTRTGIPKHP